MSDAIADAQLSIFKSHSVRICAIAQNEKLLCLSCRALLSRELDCTKNGPHPCMLPAELGPLLIFFSATISLCSTKTDESIKREENTKREETRQREETVKRQG